MADNSKGGEFLAGFISAIVPLVRAASFATALSKVIGASRRGPIKGKRRFGMADNSKGGEFLAGLILGGLIGAAIGLLLAPQPGEETRAQLREKGIELKARAEELSAEARRKAEELEEAGKEVLEEQKARLEEAIEEGKEAAAEKKEELLTKLEEEKGKKAKA